MGGIFDWLYQTVRSVIETLGYPGIYLLMLVENLFPPIPSEIVMPFAGFIASQGRFSIIWVLVAGTLGSLVGAVIIYEVGRRLGQDRLRRWICRHGKYLLMSPDDLDKSLDTFNKHGKFAVFIGRLIPGIRSLISIPAGIKHMPMPEFLALTTIGSLLWNSLLVAGGYLLGSNWQRVSNILSTYETVIYVIVGAALLYYIFKRVGSSRESESSGCEGA